MSDESPKTAAFKSKLAKEKAAELREQRSELNPLPGSIFVSDGEFRKELRDFFSRIRAAEERARNRSDILIR